MGYKPASDHPWRQYKDRPVQQKEKSIKSFKIFITEIAEGWDKVEILTNYTGNERKHFLNELPQSKQALWLSELIKKYYL